MEPLALYIHFPYCTIKCPYCHFYSVVVPRGEVPAGPFLASLAREADLVLASRGLVRPPARTLYVGGGTPSLLGAEGVEALIAALQERFDLGPVQEFTIEVNPESAAPGTMRAWRRLGVNRVSIGCQSFQPAVLGALGRDHAPEEIRGAVRAARQAGIDNVSLDLIFAAPGEGLESWVGDLREALALEPQHISLYGLSVEGGTPFQARQARGELDLPSEEEYARQYLAACETLAAVGMVHYEVSNFALPGRESLHNRAYWEGAPYLGLGPSAHSYVPPARWGNLRDLPRWELAIGRGEVPWGFSERLTREEERVERIFLALRRREGLSLDGGWVQGERVAPLLEALREEGLASRELGRLSLTDTGFLVLDEILARLLAALSLTGPRQLCNL